MLQERLLLLQNDPLVKRINAQLAPGLSAGESILNLTVEEAVPTHFAVDMNNHRSPSVGAERIELEALHGNLTGRADRLTG